MTTLFMRSVRPEQIGPWGRLFLGRARADDSFGMETSIGKAGAGVRCIPKMWQPIGGIWWIGRQI